MIILLLFMFLQNSDAVIYKLNDSQYDLMPPVMHYDSYKACQLDDEALYCTAQFVLVTDEPSPLLDMIKDYSEHRVSHYNHTKLRYGICVTQTCKTFYKHKSLDPISTLEACLNESLTNKYGLKVKALEESSCHTPGRSAKDIDRLDIVVGAVCILFLVLNVVGSIHENNSSKANKFLLHFSLQRNWNKLLTPTAEGRDPRLERIKSFDAMRSSLTMFVVVTHSFLIYILFASNNKFVEDSYTDETFYLFSNGTITMQAFFTMSAFLLIYPLLLDSEKYQLTWSMIPNRIFKRWLRLTPSYAFIVALTATWSGHLSPGPLWSEFVGSEMNDCRQYWWRNLLYINNFYEDSQCVAHAWYLAVDMQLHLFGLIVFLACKTSRFRVIMLSSLFVIGTIIPGVIVYLQDLDGILLFSPEVALELIVHDTYFNNVYIQSYCNISGYVVGIALAYLIYHWQKQGVDVKQYQTFSYRVIYYCLFPLVLLCWCSGYYLYADAPRTSIYFRSVYAALSRSFFSLLSGLFIIGLIFKFEDVFRGILEWRVWTIPSKLSYSMYLLHLMLIRNYVASRTQKVHIGYQYVIVVSLAIVVVSLAVSFFYWILIEAPLNNIVDAYLSKPKQEPKANIEKTSLNDHQLCKKDL